MNSPRQHPAVKVSGLYAVTPDEAATEALLEKVRRAIAGGAGIIQYRGKNVDPVTRLSQAEALASLTRAQQTLFIVNDCAELAGRVGAGGVHLGRDDGDVAVARAVLPGKIIGVSCYADLARAIEAEKAGADYVAFGAAFASATKPGAAPAPLSLYREAKRRLRIPVVAIGGIDLKNAEQLIAAGVDAVAVISALFNANDITAAAKGFSDLFKKARQ
ncbi:MAG: thiamine phosphate synthase [Burkholderiales bacterium]|nr:thiamine phosphate synthase [Burkholderiales bacterium]